MLTGRETPSVTGRRRCLAAHTVHSSIPQSIVHNIAVCNAHGVPACSMHEDKGKGMGTPQGLLDRSPVLTIDRCLAWMPYHQQQAQHREHAGAGRRVQQPKRVQHSMGHHMPQGAAHCGQQAHGDYVHEPKVHGCIQAQEEVLHDHRALLSQAWAIYVDALE